MKEIELSEKTVKNKSCFSVRWRNLSIGLIFEETSGIWRLSDDLKGEFWDLNDFSSKDQAVEALLEKRQNLDDFRLNKISTQK